MSIFRFFIYFTVLYTVGLAAVGIVSGIIDMKNPSVLNTPVLLATAFWVFYTCGDKNSRIVMGSEKWKLVSVALLGNVLSTCLLATPLFISGDFTLLMLLFGMIVIIPLHLLMLLFVNAFAGKYLLKSRPELAGIMSK